MDKEIFRIYLNVTLLDLKKADLRFDIYYSCYSYCFVLEQGKTY